MSIEKLGGVLTALITPFKSDGTVDFEQLIRNLHFQKKQGVYGVVPCGTTGESPTLDWSEHVEVIEHAVQFGNDLFVLAGTGSNNTKEAIEASRKAVELGVGGCLGVEGYYNKPASGQLLRHYHIPVADAVRAVLYVPYIIPGRTCCKLEPVDLKILVETCPNVRAVKEATGDLNNMIATRECVGDQFSIMSGDDGLTARMITDSLIRASGVISVMSNIVPKAIVEMVRLLSNGHHEQGVALAEQLEPLFNLVGITQHNVRHFEDGGSAMSIDKYPNPCVIKTMMAGLGLDSGYMRQPLGPMSQAAVAVVQATLLKVWNATPQFLIPLEDSYGIDVAARLHDDQNWSALADD